MAFSKVRGPGITTDDNYRVGVITATKFIGEMQSAGGDSTFQNVTIDGNLTVQGDTTTLNTTLRNVELLRVAANSATTAGIITQTGAGDILNLFDGSTEVLTVIDGGNVGIGKTNPDANTNFYIKDSTVNQIKLETTTSTSYGLLKFITSSGDGIKDKYMIAYNDGHSSQADQLSLKNQTGDITFMAGGVAHTDEKVRITSAGEVGIGITNPATILNIKSAKASDGLTITKGSNVAAFLGHNGTGDEGLLHLKDGGTVTTQIYGETGQVSFLNAGNVGIGTVNPHSPLDIHGANSNAQIRLTETNHGNTNKYTKIMEYGGTTYFQSRNDANHGGFIFRGENASTTPEFLRITSDGRVRIGGNEGNYKTVIIDESNRTTTAETSLLLYAKHDGSGNTGVGFGGGIKFWGDRNGDNAEQTMGNIMCVADVNSGTTISGALTFETAHAGVPTEKLRITSAGYLKLAGTISGSDNKLGRFLMPSHDSSEEDVMYMQMQQENTFNQLEFGGGSSSYNAATRILFRTAAIDTVTGVERLRIDSLGEVKIGAGNSGTSMTEFGSNTGGLTIDDAGVTNTGIRLSHGNDDTYLVQSSNNNFYIAQFGTGDMIFGVGATGNHRLTIQNDGNIRQTKTGANVNLTLSRNEDVGIHDTPTGVIDFANNTGHTVNARIMAKTSGTGNVGGCLLVETRNEADSTLTEKFRITSTGRVGIGTTNPDALLSIRGNSDQATTPSIRLLDGTDGREVSISNVSGDFMVTVHENDKVTDGYIKMFESGIFQVANDGNNVKLNIPLDGSSTFTGTGGNAKFTFKKGDAPDGEETVFLHFDRNGTAIGGVGGAAQVAGGESGNNIALSNVNDGQVVLATGNSGIATARVRINKWGQLEQTATRDNHYAARFVQAHSSNPAWIEIDSPSDNNLRPAYIQLQNAGTKKWGIGQVYGSMSAGAFHIAAGAQNQTNSKFTIATSGVVGIGSASPQEKLTVDGSILATAGGNWLTYATKLTSRLDSTHMMSLEAYHNSSTAQEVLGTHADAGGGNMRVVLSADKLPVGIGTVKPRGSSKCDIWNNDEGAGAVCLRLGSTIYQQERESIRFGRTDHDPDIRYHSITQYHDGVSSGANYLKFLVHNASTTTSQTETFKIAGNGKVYVKHGIDVSGSEGTGSFITSINHIGEGAFDGGLVMKTRGYEDYVFKWTGQKDHTVVLNGGSYLNAWIQYQFTQTNGGGDTMNHINGKWANNYTTHTWVADHDSGGASALANAGSGGGKPHFAATDQSGNATGSSTTDNARLTITEEYAGSSLSMNNTVLCVRVFYSSHTISITHTGSNP